MCRLDPATHEAATAREGCRTVEMRGRPLRGYVYVDAAALRTQQDIQFWVRSALDYNKVAKASAGKSR